MKSAWLITWEYDNDSAFIEDRFITLVSYKRGRIYVAELIEALYEIHTSNLHEIGISTKNVSERAYKCDPYKYDQFLICGHNPYIKGRKVENIIISKNSEGIETIMCTELSIWNWDKSTNTLLSKTEERQVEYRKCK